MPSNAIKDSLALKIREINSIYGRSNISSIERTPSSLI
jgi:hypothetical protein